VSEEIAVQVKRHRDKRRRRREARASTPVSGELGAQQPPGDLGTAA
jgi:hypothetical protein